MNEKPKEVWSQGDLYNRYVGRWSRLVAREFLAWLALSDTTIEGKSWVDVGCGTGGLAATILDAYAPREVTGIDRSAGFLAEAQRTITDPRVRFEVGDAQALPLPAAACDVAVSGLVLNFVPDAAAMVAEMRRVTKPGGLVALYVWDYTDGMQMMRHFWDAAIAVAPDAAQLDEGERFPLCQPQPLQKLFQAAGLNDVAVRPIEIATIFADFADFWTPFLGKQGSAPTYLATLDAATQEAIRQEVQRRLVVQEDGRILLTARAWAVRGRV